MPHSLERPVPESTPGRPRTLRLAAASLGLLSLLTLGACDHMDRRDRNTAAGAVIGGVAGSVLSGGSAVGTVGGAAVGAIIGNQTERERDNERERERERERQREHDRQRERDKR